MTSHISISWISLSRCITRILTLCILCQAVQPLCSLHHFVNRTPFCKWCCPSLEEDCSRCARWTSIIQLYICGINTCENRSFNSSLQNLQTSHPSYICMCFTRGAAAPPLCCNVRNIYILHTLSFGYYNRWRRQHIICTYVEYIYTHYEIN